MRPKLTITLDLNPQSPVPRKMAKFNPGLRESLSTDFLLRACNSSLQNYYCWAFTLRHSNDLLDLVSRSGISSGATFEIFRLFSLQVQPTLSRTVLLLAWTFPYRLRTVSLAFLARQCVSDSEICLYGWRPYTTWGPSVLRYLFIPKPLSCKRLYFSPTLEIF